MDFKEFSQAAAEEAAALQIEKYELYCEQEESISVSAFRREINHFSADSTGAASLRCTVNGQTAYAATELLTADSARALVRRAAGNAAVLEQEAEQPLAKPGHAYYALPPRDAALPHPDELRRTALAGQEALYAQEGVVDGCTTAVYASRVQIELVNSLGLALRHTNTTVSLRMNAVVAGENERANEWIERTAPLDTLDLNALAAKAASAARAKLGAGTAPTGAVPVVFSGKAMATLLGTYAGIFSASSAQKGLSLLKGREGEVIASGAVSLIDDPFYAQSAMPMPFDAEGTYSRETEVIQSGRLNTLLYDLTTAAMAGRTSTGNAGRTSWAGHVSVRPFTLRLAPGELTEEELLQKAGSGVYINMLGGLHAGANTISGDFSLQSAGFLIENGVKTTPVRAFTVAGNFYQLLRGITAVANDPCLPAGTSGPTSYVCPAVLAEGLTIAGK